MERWICGGAANQEWEPLDSSLESEVSEVSESASSRGRRPWWQCRIPGRANRKTRLRPVRRWALNLVRMRIFPARELHFAPQQLRPQPAEEPARLRQPAES